MQDSKPATAAEYVRMAEDSLEQSWERDAGYEFHHLAVLRAQVYASLAQAVATSAEKAAQLGREEAEHYARLEALERFE